MCCKKQVTANTDATFGRRPGAIRGVRVQTVADLTAQLQRYRRDDSAAIEAGVDTSV